MYRQLYSPQNPSASLLSVYKDGLWGKNGMDRGAIITGFWALYFINFYVISRVEAFNKYGMAFAVLSGLVGYRLNKSKFRNLPWVTLVSVIGLCGLLWLAAIASHCFFSAGSRRWLTELRN